MRNFFSNFIGKIFHNSHEISGLSPSGESVAVNSFPAADKSEGNLSRDVGLEDMILSGWYNSTNSELFPGFTISCDDVVLDFGCGEGNFLGYCSGFSPKRLIGIDVNPEAIENTRNRLAKFHGNKINLHLSSSTIQPFENGVATRIICSEVLEHVDSPAEVISELFRLGSPGALFLITVPGELAEQCQSYVAPAVYFQKPNHIRVFNKNEIEQLIINAGFEILTRSSYGYYWSVWWSLYWGTGADWHNPEHPTLINWALAWRNFIRTPGGLAAKQKLDEYMPKSIVLLARKPLTHASI